MSASIHLGFEIGTGRAVEIPLRHTAVTGQTQESGKTTTLEGLINRCSLSAIAFVTKRGEGSFHVMNPVAPYFRERSDWKFVQSLLEASVETKMDFKQTWIMRACDGAKTLDDVRTNIHKFLRGVKDNAPRRDKKRRGDTEEPKQKWILRPATGLSGDVYYALDKYFEDVMPQLQALPYSTELKLERGLNVMDLREYQFPVQALVVRSVIDQIRLHEEKTITVIPEAWKFAPKQRGSPVRLAAEEFIREGAAMKNFLWIDSQDLAGVADVLMRQIGVWIFGVQRAKHEIERALDHMPEGLPARRPRPADIATLGKGQFYVCFGREMYRVYVQPAWMSAAHAEAIARGEEPIDSAGEILTKFERQQRPVLRKMAKEIDKQQEEERMWKEKYDELKIQFDQLQEAHDGTAKRLDDLINSQGVAPTPAKKPAPYSEPHLVSLNGAPSLSDIYTYVKERASKDPAILQLLHEAPELVVKLQRVVIDIDGGSFYGRMAQLVNEGFFKAPRSYDQATEEGIRRGWCSPKTPKIRSKEYLDKLAGMGFLTREESGYQVVAGAKIKLQQEA